MTVGITFMVSRLPLYSLLMVPWLERFDAIAAQGPGSTAAITQWREVFEREPRIDAWADVYEGRIRTQLVSDLAVSLPESGLLDVSCRASSCRVTVQAPGRLAENLMMAFPVPAAGSLGGLASEDMKQEGDVIVATCTLLFRPEHRNPDAYDSWYRIRRAEMLQGIAADGGLPNGKPLPAR